MTDLSKVSTEELIRMAGVRGLEVAPKQAPRVSAAETARQTREFNAAQSASVGENVMRGVQDLPRHFGNALIDTAQGVADIPLGAGQLASKIGGFLGATDAEQSYSNFLREREAGIDERRGPNAGPNVARFTGAVVPTLGMGGVPAATLPGRMVQGAKIGGTLGTTSLVDPDSPGPMGLGYAGAKAAQIGGGTLVGAAAPPIVEGLIRGASSAVNALGNMYRGSINRVTGASSPQAIESTLQLEMQRGGVDWARLPDAVRQSVVSEVQRALNAGGTLDATAVGRLTDFTRLNMQPLSGQVSRNPAQFAQEQNLGKMEVGLPIAERLNQHNQQLIGAVTGARPGQSTDPYSAGQRVISGLQSRDQTARQGVTAAYNEARGLAGIEADVPLQPVSQRLGQVVEDFGDDKIPAAVMKRLNEFGVNGGTQTRVFNIREAEKLKTLIGNNIENPRTPQGAALTQLRASVDDAINSLSEGGAGAEAATAFQTARGQAARRFGTIDRTPALENAIGQSTAAPEKFVEKFAIRGDVQGVANFMKQLPVDSRPEVRAGVIDWIRSQSISGTDDAAKFSQAGFNRALRTIGDRKLELIFAGDRATLEQLRTIGRVGQYVQSPPVSSGVNYSGSGTTLLDALDKATRLPLIGPLLGKPSDMVRATQVARSLNGAPPVNPANPVIPEELLRRLVGPAGLLSAPAATGGLLSLQ